MLASKYKNSKIFKMIDNFDRNSFKGIVLGYITDTHFRFQNPPYRKDKFKETLANKLNDVKNIIHTHKVDALLHGGDMFDIPTVEDSTWVFYSTMLQQFGIPIYAIPGNHDMEGHNEITIPNTPIDHMSKLGIINLIIDNKDNPVIIKKNGVSVQITGRGFHGLMDQKEKENDYVLTHKKADYAVHMVHGNLLDKPVKLPGFHYTLVEEIKHTMADLTLSGHYHAGFPFTVAEENGIEKYFYNPKGFVRKSRKEIKNKPTFTLIYISEEGIVIEAVPIASAKDASEVLDLVRLDKEEREQKEIEELVYDIRSKAVITRKIKISDILNEIGSQKNISQSVKDTAMLFVREAQRELKRGGNISDAED